MSSAAETTVHVAADPAAAMTAVERVIEENRYTETQRADNGLALTFLTRKTMLSWELDVMVQVEPKDAGSDVLVRADTKTGRKKALLDGAKNRKAVDKLAEQIRAAAGA